MQLSIATLDVLKNFSSINDSIILRPGNVISTLADSRFIVGRAEVAETFPKEVPIYKGLGDLLGMISLFDQPEIEFGDKSLTISAGRNKQVFRYADASNVIAPKKDPAETKFDWNFTFSLSSEEMRLLSKAASLNNAPHVIFESTGKGPIRVLVKDDKNDLANEFSIEVGAAHATPFKIVLLRENFKMATGEYEISVHMSDKKISHWRHVGGANRDSLQFWLAIEISSTYG
jgi:hypothetical protein